ncbi:MAG: hypothetical protein HYW01_00305 [Deltaproteobacteria bacterium]|nr:hypothetical protein [Deltaproteobacteria bacterium]
MPITLFRGVTAKGCIWLWSDKEKEFSNKEVALLSSIGNQIATAVAWVKMYEERRQVWKERFKIQ